MLFEESYFFPEIRDGFYVSSRMKRTWAATLEVYKTVEKLCIDNNIEFFADYGTMLGAVRHGGFIPWDDDFDICMKREDYMRFIDIADKELPDEYACLSLYRNYKYEQLLARVVNREEFTFGEIYTEKFHGFPFNVGIDIFPMDYINDDSEAEEARRDLAKALKYHIDQYGAEETKLIRNKSEILEFADGIGFELKEGKPIRQQMYQMLDKIMSYYSDKDGDKIGTLANVMTYNSKVFSKLMYKKTIRIPFENTEVVVPLLYDNMLEAKFPNYMKCIKKWDTHLYPVYREIEEAVHEAGFNDVWRNYNIELAQNEINRQLFEMDSNQEETNKNEKSEVVFMPYMASHWKWMEPFWLSMQARSDIETYVIPIPYYSKNNIGKLSQLYYEGNMLPEYITITPFDQYDLEKRHPSKIYIQNVYDQFDSAISVPPLFYTERIKLFTDSLVCVPDFILDEFDSQDERAMYNMNFFCTAPGVINAKEVYVQSVNMRDRYIEKLVQFAGDETRLLWNKKIKVFEGDLKTNEDEGIAEEDIPDEWWSKLLKNDGTGKKVVLYFNSVSCMAEFKDKYVDKVVRVLSEFEKNNEEVTVLWVVDKRIKYLVSDLVGVVKRFKRLVEEKKQLDNIIICADEFVDKALLISDAFYGDRGHLMHLFERTRRPIMIQNIEC